MIEDEWCEDCGRSVDFCSCGTHPKSKWCVCGDKAAAEITCDYMGGPSNYKIYHCGKVECRNKIVSGMIEELKGDLR